MALASLADLDRFAVSSFPSDYPAEWRDFFSPIDDIHGVLKMVLSSAEHSLIINMYGYDDEELAQIVTDKLATPGVYVQISLDSSQAAGVHERKILAEQDYPDSSVAIGRSSKGDISHLKMVIVDGLYVVDGSTNWSFGGESKQDNQLTVKRNALAAAKARTRLDCIHNDMLRQMAAKRAKEAA